MRGITGDKLRGHIETAILSSLERGKSHGLEFVNRIEPVGSGALRRKEGFLCTALYRLEQARLVKGANGKARTRGAGVRDGGLINLLQREDGDSLATAKSGAIL